MLSEYIQILAEGRCITPVLVTVAIVTGIAVILFTVMFVMTYIETGEHGAKHLNAWREFSLKRTIW